MSKLVIVESPAKASTIKKYLGAGYEVLASMGHVRDLPKSKLGVDIEHGYKLQYVNLADKKDLLKKLRQAAADSDMVYLATDPDREGEAISWHLAELLALDVNQANRVAFNEITKTGVQKGMSNPHKIDMDLVDAQQARRALDRLVGYKLSPFLWKKVKGGLSAGRVQSVALRLVVDREKEIEAFKAQEYWSVDAKFQHSGKTFDAKLAGTADGKKFDMLSIPDEAAAAKILSELEGAAYSVRTIKKGVRNKQPAPPFITSTLQQEASRKLGFTGQRTMRVAQMLYESGHITYMRTDSLRISEEARAAGNQLIESMFGKKYLPAKPRYFKSKKNAQDAHEAIRPTNIAAAPDALSGALPPEQYKLYKLIWERFIASLMAACVQDTLSVDILGSDYLFKASGFTVRFDGFTVLYEEGKDAAEAKESALPDMNEGDALKLKKLEKNQHFTQPPPRFTEPTLIKALEENGIGRPSTYAPIISNITKREYIEREKKALKPTPLGTTVSDLMVSHFKKIMDIKFTAGMENNLDQVESGKLNWVSVLDDFYQDFAKILQKAEDSLNGVRVKVPDVETDEVCEHCGRKMVVKSGRFGKFLACPGYPECKNTKPIVQHTPGACPKCGGKMLQKKSKRGYAFYGCENYPKCDFMTWDQPVADVCPKCGKALFKKRGGILHCLSEGCDYELETKKAKKKTSEAKKK